MQQQAGAPLNKNAILKRDAYLLRFPYCIKKNYFIITLSSALIKAYRNDFEDCGDALIVFARLRNLRFVKATPVEELSWRPVRMNASE